MRIVVSSPQKTGNKWLKCLLASIYDLRIPVGSDTRQGTEELQTWIERGGFPDGSIFHHHGSFSSRVCDGLERRQSKGMARQVRVATAGDWRNHLTEAHLAIFRRCHADLIRSLGYEVR